MLIFNSATKLSHFQFAVRQKIGMQIFLSVRSDFQTFSSKKLVYFRKHDFGKITPQKLNIFRHEQFFRLFRIAHTVECRESYSYRRGNINIENACQTI